MLFKKPTTPVKSDLRSAVVEAEEEPHDQQEMRGFYSGTELLKMEIMEIPKLWEPFFPARGLAGLTGSSDCGKSMFLRQLAIAVSINDSEFLGFPLHLKHQRALYICTEDDYEGIAALLQKQRGNLEENRLSNLHFLFDTSDLFGKLSRFLEKNRVDLIVRT
jgi:hypothetical protein